MAEARKSPKQPAGIPLLWLASPLLWSWGPLEGRPREELDASGAKPQHMETGATDRVGERDFWRSHYDSGPDPEVFLT